MFEGSTQSIALASFRFVLILTMAGKKEFCYSSEKTRGNLVALCTTATFIVLKA